MDDNYYQTTRALREIRDQILWAIERKELEPTLEVIEHLVEINIELGEA